VSRASVASRAAMICSSAYLLVFIESLLVRLLSHGNSNRNWPGFRGEGHIDESSCPKWGGRCQLLRNTVLWGGLEGLVFKGASSCSVDCIFESREVYYNGNIITLFGV